jgi:lipopolysaccharide export system protein LptA
MSAQRASAPVRFVRLAAAVVLVALAVAVVVKLADRPGEPPASAVAPPPAAGPVTLQTNIRHEEYKDGRLVAVVSGDTFSVGADGRNRLKGGVDVVNYGPAGEETSHLTADDVAYDKETLVFEIAGRVRIEVGGVVLEGETFSFDKAKGIFGTTAGGRFSSKALNGRAPEVFYAEAEDEIRLGGGFAAEIAASEGGEGRLALAGRSLRYARRKHRGRIEERASIEGPDFRAAAGAVSFVAATDETGLDSAVLEDSATVVLRGRDASTGGEIQADRIEVTFSREPSGIDLEASGRAVLSLHPRGDEVETLSAPTALLSFSREDRNWTWSVRRGIRVEIGGAGGPGRTLVGEAAWFDGGGMVHAAGAAGRPAVADSADARIEAPSIAVATASGGLLATGGVTAMLKQGDGSRRTGFFARGENVSVSCRGLETRPGTETTFLTGDVLVRQGNEIVRAAELELAGDEGRMSGGGGVAVTISEAEANGRAGRTVELTGQDMAYRPDTRTITLTTKAALRLPEARLEAGSISAVVARDGRTLETLEAGTAVVVSKGRFSGRAEAASYDAATGRITLTGQPVLTDEKGGSARGAKLTFDLADDKILIENEGPGRATTVIRS